VGKDVVLELLCGERRCFGETSFWSCSSLSGKDVVLELLIRIGSSATASDGIRVHAISPGMRV